MRAEPGVDWGITLAGEKQGSTLVLVALDGFGGKLFSLVQRGRDVEIERAFGRRMPWPPLNVLRDLHRARFGAPAGPRVSVEVDPASDPPRTVVRDAGCASETAFVASATPPRDAP